VKLSKDVLFFTVVLMKEGGGGSLKNRIRVKSSVSFYSCHFIIYIYIYISLKKFNDRVTSALNSVN